MAANLPNCHMCGTPYSVHGHTCNSTASTPTPQSDAPPSAEEFLNLSAFLSRSDTPSSWFLEFAEAYAALRTAQRDADYETERTYHAAWEKRAMQAEAETRELISQRNMWKGIVTAGCDKHKDAPEEEYPADCFICQAAKVAQLERERDNALKLFDALGDELEKQKTRAETAESQLAAKEYELDTLSKAHKQMVTQLATLREETIQECAQVVDKFQITLKSHYSRDRDLAAAIRSLAQPQKVTKEEEKA